MKPIVIIGGGPAGATLACYLALGGKKVTLLEYDMHPRPHVGESFLLASNKVFRDIGVWDLMHAKGFVKKRGVTWHPASSGQAFSTPFSSFPDEAVDEDYAFHVDRADFDLMLLKHAHTLGVDVVQGARVREVLFDGERATGVSVEIAGQRLDIPADIVADASGRKTVIGSQLRMKKSDPILNQQAIFTWFDHVDRGPAEGADYLHIHYLPVTRGWVWQIPLSETRTSIGVVVDRDTYRDTRRDIDEDDLEAHFNKIVAMSPSATRALAPATRLSAFQTEGNYSYSMDRYVGDGYLLVGDAARFVDPIFSSGVETALFSAKFAAEALLALAPGHGVNATSLAEYERRSRALSDVWLEFARSFYRLPSLWTYYMIRDRSEHSAREFIRLITGLITDRNQTTILDEMAATIKMVEESPDHVWKRYLRAEPGADS